MADQDSIAGLLTKFFDGNRDSQPNIKALAEILRSDKPLPKGFRWVIAEALDSSLPGKLACNWQLVPVFTGRADKENKLERLSNEVRRNLSGLSSSMPGAAKAAGMSERKAWSVWNIIKLRKERLARIIKYSQKDT